MSASSPGTAVTSRRFRAVAAATAAIVLLNVRPALVAPVLGLLALTLGVVVRPSLLDSRWFNVALGGVVTVYGVLSVSTAGSVVGRAVGAAVAVLGLLVVLNHLGVVPWSDHDDVLRST